MQASMVVVVRYTSASSMFGESVPCDSVGSYLVLLCLSAPTRDDIMYLSADDLRELNLHVFAKNAVLRWASSQPDYMPGKSRGKKTQKNCTG